MITLRPYQAQVYKAALHSAVYGLGHSIAVMMARQAGKNETSAQIETALLTLNYARGGTGIKAAPTAVPQVQISRDRLTATLNDQGMGAIWRARDPYIYLGRARWAFHSAAPESHVVGATADILLEADEAQDINPDKWNKDFRPMASTTNATTVYYGTPWTDDSLLAQAIAAGEEAQRKDGLRRVFLVPWTVAAEHNPAYARYVQAERDRLGANHPLFLTQYELQTLPGTGRLLSPAQLAALQGDYPRQDMPQAEQSYVAGIDVAGEDTAATTLKGRDSTVLTIARVMWEKPRQPPTAHIVQAYEWQGTSHADLYPLIAQLLRETWHVRRVAVDSTTLGEALTLYLEQVLPSGALIPVRFTESSKSQLGYDLQAAATTGRLKIWANDQTLEYQKVVFQLRQCRATYKPNRMVAWAVPEAEGHDDYAVSVALCNRAAQEAPAPRLARARIQTKE